MLKFLKFFKGIIFKRESAPITYDASTEGALYNNSNTELRTHIEGADREITTNDQTQTLTNKTIDADSNTLSNIDNDEIKASAGIDATKIADGSVDNTEFQRLNGVTGDIQTQIDAKQDDVITTEGDVIIGDGSGDPIRLGIGTNGQVLKSDGTTASWENESAGFSDPMTTRGDIIFRDATNTTDRLAVGTNGQVLTSDGTDASWEDPAAGFADPMTTRGDIIFRNASNTTDRLAVGTSGQVLTSDGTDASWEDAATSSNAISVSQTAHGLAVGDVIKSNGTNDEYEKAQADTAENAAYVGVVSAVGGANDFEYITHGLITGLSSLTAGTLYYLSDTTAGDTVTSEPSIVRPIYRAISATTAVVVDLSLESGADTSPVVPIMIMAGGNPASGTPINEIRNLDPDSGGANSSDWGDLATARELHAVASNTVSMIVSGGRDSGSTSLNDFEKGSMTSSGNATQFSTAGVARTQTQASANDTYYMTWNGQNPNTNDVTRVAISAETVSTGFATALFSSEAGATSGDDVSSVSGGGNNGTTQLQETTYASGGAAANHGSLNSGMQRPAGAAFGSTALCCGSTAAGASTTEVKEFDIGTGVDADGFATMNVARTFWAAAGCSQSNLVVAGGDNPAGTPINSIDDVGLPSGGTMSDFGDLQGAGATSQFQGTTNDHAGVS